MSVHHKASITEEGGSDEGVTWWSRACNADREAVILIDSADAELLLQDAEHYRRPPKPRAPPPLYCYIGMGIDRQPNCLTGMVVRTKNHEMTAAVATACRILSFNFPGKVPVEITADRIAIGEELWEIGALNDLVARTSSMWVSWADHTAQPHRMLGEIMLTLERSGPPTRPVPPQPPADPDQTAARVLQLYAMDDDLPDWGPSSDEDEVAVVPPPVLHWAALSGYFGVFLSEVFLW
jgi:hypothetical protein